MKKLLIALFFVSGPALAMKVDIEAHSSKNCALSSSGSQARVDCSKGQMTTIQLESECDVEVSYSKNGKLSGAVQLKGDNLYYQFDVTGGVHDFDFRQLGACANPRATVSDL